MTPIIYVLLYFSILVNFYQVLEVQSADVDVSSVSDALLCRRCGHEIVTSPKHLKNIASKLALRQRNDTIMGVDQCLIQLFKNPDGHHFELITAEKADVQTVSEAFAEYSWFPKYSWRVAQCPQCHTHLGWTFEDTRKSHKEKPADQSSKGTTKYSFIGLIFPNLIPQNYADSLLITPRAYRS